MQGILVLSAAPLIESCSRNAQEIRRDAFWLQRRITEEFGSAMDAGAAQQLSEKVFKTLEVFPLPLIFLVEQQLKKWLSVVSYVESCWASPPVATTIR